MPVKGQRGAKKRAWELFAKHGLSIAMVVKRLRAEGYALTNAGHPTRTEVENAIRREAVLRTVAKVEPRKFKPEVPW
jgi:hypothetical protein